MINLLLGFGSRFIFCTSSFFFSLYYTIGTKRILVFIKTNDTFFHKASEKQVRDRETINEALMQIFVHLVGANPDLWIFFKDHLQQRKKDKNGYKENKWWIIQRKKYLLRIFLFFQLNLNWKWCLTKGGGSEDIKHSRIKFTTKMKFRWSILCWKKHHKSKRAKPPKVVRMPTMSTHQHECIVQSYEHLVFSAPDEEHERNGSLFA